MNRFARAALAVSAAVFATCAAVAQAAEPEPDASLLARTPALTLSGGVVPLAGPVAIGGAGWGAFRRLCVTRHLIQPDGKEVLETEPSCFTATGVRREGAVWHLELLTDPLRGGPRVAFATTRDAEGRVGEVAVTVPDGQPVPPPAMMARLQTLFRVMIEAHGIARRSVVPGERFLLPLALSAADPDTITEDGGFTCVPDGTATLRGRDVLAATCRGTARTDFGEGALGRIDIAGRFAIDVETGMVLQHRYASFLFMEKDPKKVMPNLRWRGVSRQDLE
jgi:hypothetical protein